MSLGNYRSQQFNKAEYSAFIGGDPIRNSLHYYCVMQELGELKGQDILDVGCGDGLFDEILAKQGAKITGYDKAGNLISIAAKRSFKNHFPATFQVATPLDFKSNRKFQNAISVMVLPYSESEEYLKHFFTSTSQAVKPQGKFISIIFNPDFKKFKEQLGNRRFIELGNNEVEVQFLDPKTGEFVMPAKLTQYTKAAYEQAAVAGGFKDLQWKTPHPSPESLKQLGDDFWKALLENPPYSMLIATK